MDTSHLLSVHHFDLAFVSEGISKQVLYDINFEIESDEILGVVGESGSGKSVTSLAILGLLPKGNTKILKGDIRYQNNSLLEISEKEFRKLRGKEIAMIFQEPMSSLNPSMKCGKQVLEILLQHTTLSKAEAKKETLLLFEKVKLPDPERAYISYPSSTQWWSKNNEL